MPKKKTRRVPKPKLEFKPMKPRKGFLAVQLVIAVSPDGDRGVFIVDDESPSTAIEEAREDMKTARGYDATEAARRDAAVHLVETYLPLPKPIVVKKAKTRSKKVADPKPKADDAVTENAAE